MDFGLRDVHVLITGASGGIGLATVCSFLQVGARVTAHYNNNPAPLAPLLVAHGPARLRASQADVTREADVAQLFAAAAGEFGPVQVVVVNHARYEARAAPLAQMALEQWEATLRTNLTSAFLVVRAYLRGLEGASGGTAGKYGEAGHADYAATKSAMMYGLCLSLKNEIVKIAPGGRVNAIAPGWVKTPMAEESLMDPNVVYQALATTPLKKVATPEDVAGQVVIMSSPTLSGHISGQVLMIEGGMEGRLLNERKDLGL
ncbi:NAD-P-binding protein [Trametes elegans]|nr:NAD-P-binding protein [Trametes elegans]